MPLLFVRNDITRMRVDAIVNAANNTLLGGGGVDGCIHRAAGPGLLAECRTLGGCETGMAKATRGYRLPCRYVIHTVGPIWNGGRSGEEARLKSCYRESLRVAQGLGCESVAFPLISSGVYGYPIREAIRVATNTIRAFLSESDMTVYLVFFDRRACDIGEELEYDIALRIDEQYVCDVEDMDIRRRLSFPRRRRDDVYFGAMPDECRCAMPEPAECAMPEPAECAMPAEQPLEDLDLSDLIERMDAGFSETLLKLIDLRGMTDAQCYKRANVDRKLFSKIRSDPAYRPSKPTVLAFAISLRLSLAETRDLLMKAGFALSHSSKFDIIIEYFIGRGIYDIDVINEALFSFDQSLLGA